MQCGVTRIYNAPVLVLLLLCAFVAKLWKCQNLFRSSLWILCDLFPQESLFVWNIRKYIWDRCSSAEHNEQQKYKLFENSKNVQRLVDNNILNLIESCRCHQKSWENAEVYFYLYKIVALIGRINRRKIVLYGFCFAQVNVQFLFE